jgi:hypothetical protein
MYVHEDATGAESRRQAKGRGLEPRPGRAYAGTAPGDGEGASGAIAV